MTSYSKTCGAEFLFLYYTVASVDWRPDGWQEAYILVCLDQVVQFNLWLDREL